MLLAIATTLICILSPLQPSPATTSDLTTLSEATVTSEATKELGTGLTLENIGTSSVYFAHQGKPLLSFGGMSDFLFYADVDTFDYKRWTDWAADHGMNHLRAYPPLSWKYIDKLARENGGSPENLLFPYEETSPGSRQFDLTRFNDAYWARFREQCEYLQSKGIIIHLLMVNAWQTNLNADNWEGHFFNPDNNVNDFTEYLRDNHLSFYKSVADGQTGLVKAQQAWFRKIIEETADLDNVYYDLIHEIAENYEDWGKAKPWIETMAETTRSHFASQQPNRDIILGMDTGGLENRQREWVFNRPYFDVLIYGKSHTVDQARRWRDRYKKPYIPQESWDDEGTKYSLRNLEHRVRLRKYLWKFMMAKVQQMDIYAKPVTKDPQPGPKHNYDPNGWNPFEDDAVILRQLWNQLTDYANLRFNGRVQSGPGQHQYVLSSSQEGLVYLSSATRQEDVPFEAEDLRLRNMALANGDYAADIISPEQGALSTSNLTVDRGRTAIALPAFSNELAIHIYREADSANQPQEQTEQTTASQTGNTQTISTEPINTEALGNSSMKIVSLIAVGLATVSGFFAARKRKNKNGPN